MPTGNKKYNFYFQKDGEYIPVTDLQEITMEEAEWRMEEIGFVKVVRCKDCKHYRPEHEYCVVWDMLRTNEHGYCHRGERR